MAFSRLCVLKFSMNDIAPYHRELSERQAAFVKAFVETGDAHIAGLAAGYAPSTARNGGTQLLDSPAVILAIGQAARLRLARGAPIALNTVEHLMKNAVSERVRLEAAKAWLDRAGLVAPKPPDDNTKPDKALHELTHAELIALASQIEGVLGDRAKNISPDPADLLT
jgi:terminase small subunit-like protein